MSRYAAQTSVGADRSRAEIERILERYGASSFAYGKKEDAAVIVFELGGKRIRFNVPLPTIKEFMTTEKGRRRTEKQAEEAREQAVRQRWRALSLIIKAKLEYITSGMSTLEEEFMSAIMLPSGATVGEWMKPQLERSYGSAKMPPMLPGAGGTL